MATENIKSILKKKRPNLTDSTLKTYTSILTTLFRKLNGSGTLPDYFKSHSKDVISKIKDYPLNTRKTILATLTTLTDNDAYRTPMMIDAKKHSDEQRSQVMSDKQKENWMSQDEILGIYKRLEKSYSHLFTKSNLSKRELNDLMDYVLLSLYVLIPPRRSKEYTLFKVRNIGKDDPHMEKGYFIFPKSSFKTGKFYGPQRLKIPRKLSMIIKKWSTKHGNDYLLFDNNGKPFTIQKLTLRLNHIFGKKISSTLLRHIYISDSVLKDMPPLTELEKVASEMGHSTGEQILYKKLDKDNTKGDVDK